MTPAGVPDRPGLPCALLAELEWRGILHATTPGLADRLATRPPDRRLHRLRPDRRLAPRRPPRADLRAAAAPALRRPARRARGRRDRDDRRPVGPLGRAEPARPRDARAQRRRDPGVSSSGSSTSRAGSGGAVMVNNLDWLGRALADRLPARHRQALHGARTCSPRTPSRSGSSAGCRSPSSATCCSRQPTSSICTGPWASSSRWAARTSGATSRPVSS